MNADGLLWGFTFALTGVIVGAVLCDTLFVRRDGREAMLTQKITELAEANQLQAAHIKRLQAHVRAQDAYIADHSDTEASAEDLGWTE